MISQKSWVQIKFIKQNFIEWQISEFSTSRGPILEALSREGYMEFFAHPNKFYQMGKKPGGVKISMSKILKSANTRNYFWN